MFTAHFLLTKKNLQGFENLGGFLKMSTVGFAIALPTLRYSAPKVRITIAWGNAPGAERALSS
ncbi:MAG: hypothetical protein DRR19_09865 [Candidatus Parabeggiatoa sp. nov. 1]|nr:MAG: hypothetical protein DRR19_09865 [Gammaproteobacteria bacterium]